MASEVKEVVKAKRARRDVRHTMLVKEILLNQKREKPLTQEQMMRRVGYSKSTAHAQMRRVLSSESIKEAFEENGINPNSIQKVIKDAMNAKVVTIFKGDAFESDAPDHKVRMAAVSLAGDFTGTKKVVVESKSININAEPDDMRQLLGI